MYSPSFFVRMNRIFLVLSQNMSHTVPSGSKRNWHLPCSLGDVSTVQPNGGAKGLSDAKLIAGRVKQSTSSSIFISFLPRTVECGLVVKITRKSVIHFAPHANGKLFCLQYLTAIGIRAIAYLFHLSTSWCERSVGSCNRTSSRLPESQWTSGSGGFGICSAWPWVLLTTIWQLFGIQVRDIISAICSGV